MCASYISKYVNSEIYFGNILVRRTNYPQRTEYDNKFVNKGTVRAYSARSAKSNYSRKRGVRSSNKRNRKCSAWQCHYLCVCEPFLRLPEIGAKWNKVDEQTRRGSAQLSSAWFGSARLNPTPFSAGTRVYRRRTHNRAVNPSCRSVCKSLIAPSGPLGIIRQVGRQLWGK